MVNPERAYFWLARTAGDVCRIGIPSRHSKVSRQPVLATTRTDSHRRAAKIYKTVAPKDPPLVATRPRVAAIGSNYEMRVFVLSTGRAGTTTFARACSHCTNYTSGHESRAGLIGAARFEYPDDHVEVDNRLSWFPGHLATHFPDARYVHLIRERDATARSFLAGWPADLSRLGWLRHARRPQPGAGLMYAFAYGIIARWHEWPREERGEVSRFLVDTINSNIAEFLQSRSHVAIALEDIHDDFPRFWRWISAEGDLDAAMREWDVHHNRTPQ